MTIRRRPTTSTVVKDTVLFLAGLAIMGQQLLFTPRADFNTMAWITALVLVGVPGASQLLLPVLGRVMAAVSGTGAEPSSPPVSESPPPSPASSTTSQGPDP